jgi:hypothetical protein
VICLCGEFERDEHSTCPYDMIVRLIDKRGHLGDVVGCVNVLAVEQMHATGRKKQFCPDVMGSMLL